MTDTNGKDGIVIYDATKTKRICNQNSVGILSFEKVCEIKKIPITTNMIKPVFGDNQNLPLYKSMYIKLPESVAGKTVALSIGGYFTFLEPQLYTVVNNDTIKLTLDVGNLFIDRLYESRKYIDLSTLELEIDPRNDSFLEVAAITNDTTIEAYMTMSQSFVIVFDHPNLYKSKLMLRNIQMPNKVISYTEPTSALIGGLGRMPEYWSVHEAGQWALSFADRDLAHRLYNTTTEDSYITVTDHTRSIERARLASTYMLEIGKDI